MALPCSGVQPGDVGFDYSSGLVAWAVRLSGTYAHTFTFDHLLATSPDGSEVWATVETFPNNDPALDGTCPRRRTLTRPAPGEEYRLAVMRPARTQSEADAIVAAAAGWAARHPRYDWAEIARILLDKFGVKVDRWSDSDYKAICSHQVADCIVDAIPEFGPLLPYPPSRVWPGLLAAVLTAAGVPSVRLWSAVPV